MGSSFRAVAVGVSAGGLDALSVILPELPASLGVPVFIVQHIHDDADEFLVRHLSQASSLPLRWAEDKMPILPGTIYLAPPGYHLLIENERMLSLSVEARVLGARPSIDVLFETAADTFGEHLVGVILTGASRDGVTGLHRIKSRGGLALVQDPSSAEWSYMPSMAVAEVQVDAVLPPQALGKELARILTPTE